MFYSLIRSLLLLVKPPLWRINQLTHLNHPPTFPPQKISLATAGLAPWRRSSELRPFTILIKTWRFHHVPSKIGYMGLYKII